MSTHDIAIIGVSFEFPGVKDLEGFWNGLSEGRCFYHCEPSEVDHTVPAWGSVEDVRGFDYRFFGYSYKEACCMDPQHRLLLQHSWHAMEDAGYMNRDALPVTGVYASASLNQYLFHNLHGQMDAGSEDEVVIGNTHDFLATRLAYKLNLTGPALNIQCGCSSALAGIHEARVALLTKQCDLALVAAVSLSAPHDQGYPREQEGIRSGDGYIRPFDSKASGTVFTNGVAALVLKRYDEACRAGDRILGVIAASAINNDGAQKASFTAPAVKSQAQVISKAHKLAKVDPRHLVLVEAHGTGTAL
ncbi:MAG: polyketide synthase, partial [Chlamydiia bacterium]|nr:polyketide synthase [Chlamydiia bacterium]